MALTCTISENQRLKQGQFKVNPGFYNEIVSQTKSRMGAEIPLVIPALGRVRQEDYNKFKVKLVYSASKYKKKGRKTQRKRERRKIHFK